MTLPPLAQIVKRARTERPGPAWISLGGILAGAALVLASVDALLAERARERMDGFGHTLAETTAYLGLPAVLQQDRIALGNLASRLILLDEVVGCGFYTVDGRALAFAGQDSQDPNTRHYPAPVSAEDTLAGYARVVLDRRQFRLGRGELAAAAWPILPAALAIAALIAWVSRRARGKGQAPGDAPETPHAKFVLVANLFNQGSLSPTDQQNALTHASKHASDLADAHGGRSWTLSGARILMALDDTDDDARPLDVVSAALALGTALGALPPPDQDGSVAPSFRFGLHLGDAWGDEVGAEEAGVEAAEGSPHVRDAALLSALAPDGRLAISQGVFERIGDTNALNALDVVDVSELSQAALADSTLGRCRIVRGLQPSAS